MSFCTTVISKVCASCSKSPLQIHVGSVSRIYKLGAERVFLISSYITTINVTIIPINHLVNVRIIVLNTKLWFGGTCVRAIYNICSSTMQIILKVKSGGNIYALSPTLSILEGCSSKIVIYLANNISLLKEVGGINWDIVVFTCSLTHLSRAPQHHKARLVSSFISLVCADYNINLDEA